MSVTAPQGFRAAGVAAGLKESASPDVAVVLNSGGANACTGPLGFQDTHATAEHLAAALDDSAATATTFDRLDTDGCMSTNDTVLLASGASGVHPDRAEFTELLTEVCADLAAVGTTDAVFDPDQLNVAINGVWVCRHGAAGDERGKVDLYGRDVTITVDLSAGPQSAVILTTDLAEAYVHENSAYLT